MKIKLLLPLSLLLVLLPFHLTYGQEETEKEDPGKVSAKIYSNFNFGFNDDNPTTAFEVTRAYFGYERNISEHFYANVKLDIGSPDDLSAYSKLRRYAYFKNASIRYRNGNFTAWAGLFDMVQFKVQEKFWGYRYLYKSYMDEYRFGPSADIGLSSQYKFNDIITADITISNGEGYTAPQRDESYKVGGGLTIEPTDRLVLRAYYAIFTHDSPQMTFSGFAGYRADKFRLGSEFNYQKNYKFNFGHHRYGYSIYSTYIISDTWEVFGRYDQLYSNILENDLIPWNLPDDGSAIVAGLQFTPVKNIHITLDYQDWVEWADNGTSEPFIYMHFEAVF